MELETSVFLNDLHIPYQDRDVVRVVLSLIKDLQPEHIFLNGDILDCYQLSKYDKDPERINELQEDLDDLDTFLTNLRSIAPRATIVYTEGNHEHRLIRYLWNHPEIASLRGLKPEELFQLGKHNIQWVPESTLHRHHGFIVTHGSVVKKHAGQSAMGEHQKYGLSGISGHTHRAGTYSHTNASGEYIWIENGCLCELNPDYCVAPDWQWAVSVGTFIKNDNRFQIDQIRIPNKKLLYHGKLYT